MELQKLLNFHNFSTSQWLLSMEKENFKIKKGENSLKET